MSYSSLGLVTKTDLFLDGKWYCLHVVYAFYFYVFDYTEEIFKPFTAFYLEY